ncbi:MAG: glutamine--tRNA ligase/YqeY domain fusion protein [Gammaproteobacteria bacterium]|nr:glutamine--tRNA ligase/YqeY domain fusion protein [Gammaproteobacteria bacterium]
MPGSLITDAPPEARDFIRQIVAEDLESGRHTTIVTRFPPEPNGYLHVGHAKSICLNFGVAAETGGRCILRLDDTNPLKEDQAFVDAIVDNVHWLGFDWGDRLTHASDYFRQIHDCAVELIDSGKAYVDSLSQEKMREYRGTLTAPGRESPHRSRSVAENRELFAGMRAGEFADGEHVLRAKIDMGSPNINLRDPVLYRIRRATHQRTGDTWCIYPMYDFAHTISDAIEGITHSLCTLEFEDHRPLYEWILANLKLPARPRQIEFSRLNLAFTITSKRKLAELIQLGHVTGWDDPRLPTIAGMRRRGYPPEALRDFAGRIGVTKKEHIIQMSLLENCVRENLNVRSARAMAVLNPLKVVLTNYPEGQTEMLAAVNHPDRPELGERQLPFGRELLIEQDDFMENAPKKFFRLQPGGEVRLRYGYIIKCVDMLKDAEGRVTEVHCTYDPETRSGLSGAERKVKGTIHWVSAAHAVRAEVRLYDRLFAVSRPDGEDADFKTFLNPESLRVKSQARLEPSLAAVAPGTVLQFERLGYFVADSVDHGATRPVFNRVVSLRDSWAKIEAEAT